MGCEESKHKTLTKVKRLRTDTENTDAGDSLNSGNNVRIVRGVLLGDASVGKSSLSVRYFNDEFPEHYDITFGGVFFKKSIDMAKDLTVSLQMWDTGGQQKYRSMTPLYYRNAGIAFLVCSLNDQNPLSSLQYWLNQLSEKVQKQNMTIIVLANKCDLDDNSSSQPIKSWCSRNHLQLFQCSAKTGANVKQAFTRALNLHLLKTK